MKKKLNFLILVVLALGISGCMNGTHSGELENVGLLVPETVNDGVWGTKGYKGLLKIQSDQDVDVFYKESMVSDTSIEQAVKEYEKKDVNLVFGHGSEYADVFNHISKEHTGIHFVSFNGNALEENTTSLKFKGYAMGFFGGMTAAYHSKTERIGVIAAYDWQPEVEGFVDGAKFQKKNIGVDVEYTSNWDDKALALERLDKVIGEGADVVYPAGDGYNVAVIEELKERGLFAIGFVSDQSDLGQSTVLTSTVQHADKLYEVVADRFSKGELPSGNLEFDFQDGVISMGQFSPLIPEDFQSTIKQHVKHYIDTGILPNGKEAE
ncbi:BMP family ABC transporter substrate-binding protein [Rossellomorea aquimaris]|uniref:BMP family ABC transporter substrate-binding protein n=1 Tax=Rossellomorea aquimaris TaxID=189382 RepID=UPI001CD7D3C2|nr:BMP family ABC transporter substrate-binding protein [Rossellomorea aquimaris]MCA1056752.1 BMP family ABC transporter substrate-binding protein [Rossellomorea aquimaris]